MARVPAIERRADLVNAAVRVIATCGIDGATTRRIAEQANAPLATLHYCFVSKELLFEAVVGRLAAEYRDVVARGTLHSDVAITAREMLEALMMWYLESPDFGAATIELISWARRQEGEAATILYNETLDMMRSILEKAADGKDVNPDTIDEITYVVASLADGFGLNSLAFADREAAITQMEVTLAVLDAWLSAKLGNTVDCKSSAGPATEASALTACAG